jgi:hypothetical protein
MTAKDVFELVKGHSGGKAYLERAFERNLIWLREGLYALDH